jgi:hypothetical protein
MLLAASGERRPTAHIDFLARQVSNDIDAIAAHGREILAVEVDDGVAFKPSKLRTEVIREADLYTGVPIVFR